MTDVPCFYVNPPEVTVASVTRVRQQKRQQQQQRWCSSMDVDMQTQRGSCSSKEGAGQRGRKRKTGRAVKLSRGQGDSSKGQLCSEEKNGKKSAHTCITHYTPLTTWNKCKLSHITGTCVRVRCVRNGIPLCRIVPTFMFSVQERSGTGRQIFIQFDDRN